jgi:hypothetical protein
LHQNGSLSEDLTVSACLRHSLSGENIAQTQVKVNPCGGKNGKILEKYRSKVADKSGCVLTDGFRVNCNFFTTCCVEKFKRSAYFV